MNSPIIALTWELWRLERSALGARLLFATALGLFLGWLSTQEFTGYSRAFSELAYFVIWLTAVSAAFSLKLGHDGAGFPLALNFTRPAPTWLIAMVPFAFVGLSRALLFVVSALLVRAAFDLDFRILPVALSILTLTLVVAACEWWTQSKFLRGFVWCCVGLVFSLSLAWSYSAADPDGVFENWINPELSAGFFLNLSFWLAAAMALTLVGVGRQRHGVDGGHGHSHAVTWRQLLHLEWNFLLPLKRCPTTSATAAEIWRELKLNGVPTLASAVLMALAIPILSWMFSAWSAIEGDPPWDAGSLGGLASILFIPLFVASRNLFDIQRRQGVASMSLYDAVRPASTAKLLAVKMAVILSVMLVAAALIIASYWFNASRLGNNFVVAVSAASNAKSWPLVLALVWVVQLATLLLCLATAQVYVVLKAKGLILLFAGGFGLIIYTAAMASLGDRLGVSLLALHLWLIAASLALVTVYVFHRLIRDNLLKPLQSGGIVGAWLCFVLAYFSLAANGVSGEEGMPVVYWVWKSILAMLPLLTVGVSLRVMGLFRHRY